MSVHDAWVIEGNIAKCIHPNMKDVNMVLSNDGDGFFAISWMEDNGTRTRGISLPIKVIKELIDRE